MFISQWLRLVYHQHWWEHSNLWDELIRNHFKTIVITHRKMDDYNNVYPQLYQNNKPQTGQNFWLKQCSEWLAYLERELDARKNIYKKYKRARSLFLNVSTASGTISVALSAGGLGTGMTGVGLPVAVSLVWSVALERRWFPRMLASMR